MRQAQKERDEALQRCDDLKADVRELEKKLESRQIEV